MLRTPKDRPLFSPLDSIAERAAAASGHRRPDQKPTLRETDRTVGEVYDSRAINRAVTRAIASANADPARDGLPKIPHWHPHQIRHAFATRARALLGLQHASAALGHADLQTTQIYAELETGLAISVAEKMG